MKSEDDVKKFADMTLRPGYIRNNYFYSFIEQELCFRSRKFLGSSLSSWTQTVLLDRIARGNYDHSSVLHSLGPPNPAPPGYPPFFFQFPEGWFKFAFPYDSNGRYYAPDYALAQGQPRPNDAQSFNPGHNFQNDKPEQVPDQPRLIKRTVLKSDKPSSVQPELSKCKPKSNIVFVKTHKTGSSTVTNILMRYAENKKLKVALPIKGINDLGGYPAPMDDKLVDGNKVNIIAHHFRHSRSVDNLLENPKDTKFITILRNPVHQVKSTFSFFRDQAPFDSWFDTSESINNRLQKFYNNPRQIYNTNSNWYFRTKNFQSFDIGQAQEKFDLVLLTDYFNESLVLLKNLLCWDWDDVAYLKFKESADTSEPDKKTSNEMDTDLKNKIMNWNSKDAELYRKHNATFWKKIESYSQDLENMICHISVGDINVNYFFAFSYTKCHS